MAIGANAGTAAIGLGIAFGTGMFPVEGRTIVPIGGMVVGNAMKAGVVAAQRMRDEVAGRREEIEARLALGPPADEAAKPLSRGVLRTAISPQVERRRVFTPDHRLIPLRRSAEQTTAFWRAAATSGRYRCSDSRWDDF